MCVFLGFSCEFLIFFDSLFGLTVAIRIGEQANTTDDSGIREDKALQDAHIFSDLCKIKIKRGAS